MAVRGEETGLTLIEMLVVLAIIGIAAGVTILGMGFATRGASAAAEAHRLASTLRLAADDAMIGDRRLRFTWQGSTYGFSGAGTAESLASHTLPLGVRLVMTPTSGSLPIGVDGSGGEIVARLEGGNDLWVVRYDGVTVTAREVPAA